VAIAAFSSEHENFSNYIMDELAGALVDGSLEVADRRNLAFVYQELGFQMSGDVSDESAAAIGKFLGAPYVITGRLVKAGNRYRYRLAGINVETAVQESSTRLDVRGDRAFQSLLADVRTAPIVTTAADYGAGAATPKTAVPKTAGALLDRGILFAMRGDYELAAADFSEAIQLDGALATAYVLRGRALYASVVNVTGLEEGFSGVTGFSTGGNAGNDQKVRYARAATDFTQAIRIDPNNKIAYKERGLMYNEQGDHDRAIADYNQAIRLDPNYAAAYNNRGLVYSDKGDYDRAIADYTQAIRLDTNDATAYYNRGVAYYIKGDYDRAIADYNQAIRLDPNDAAAYNNRGVSYANKGDYDHAIADYNQAIRLDPNHALAYVNRGLVYSDKGDYDRAIADFEAALRINPNDANARDNLELARWLRGR
jgi:tetratricopeptide (TPR) repeat protein